MFTGTSVTLFISVALEKSESLHLHLLNCKDLFSSLTNGSSQLFIFGTFLHTFSLLSSSFVEEEHQTWYSLTTTYFIVSFVDKVRQSRNLHKQRMKPASQKEAIWIKSERTEKGCETRLSNALSDDSKISDEDIKESVNSSFPVSETRSNGGLKVGDDRTRTITQQQLASVSHDDVGRNCYKGSGCGRINRLDFLQNCAATIVLLVCVRLSRSFNQTGIKWANRPDVGDWLVKPENKTVLSLSLAVALILLTGIISLRSPSRSSETFTSVIFFVGTIGVYIYRGVTGIVWLPWLHDKPITKGVSEARFVYFCVASLFFKNFVALWRVVKLERGCETKNFSSFRDMVTQYLDGLLSSILLLQALLLRPHNVMLLVIFVIEEYCVTRYIWKRLVGIDLFFIVKLVK